MLTNQRLFRDLYRNVMNQNYSIFTEHLFDVVQIAAEHESTADLPTPSDGIAIAWNAVSNATIPRKANKSRRNFVQDSRTALRLNRKVHYSPVSDPPLDLDLGALIQTHAILSWQYQRLIDAGVDLNMLSPGMTDATTNEDTCVELDSPSEPDATTCGVCHANAKVDGVINHGCIIFSQSAHETVLSMRAGTQVYAKCVARQLVGHGMRSETMARRAAALCKDILKELRSDGPHDLVKAFSREARHELLTIFNQHWHPLYGQWRVGGSKTIQVSDLRKLGTTLSKAVAIFLDEGVARVTDVHDCLDILAKGAPWKVHLAAMHTMFTSITCAKMCKGKSKDRALHFRATVLERKSKDESSAWGSSPAVREMIQDITSVIDFWSQKPAAGATLAC